ncbi:flagellin, partial [Pseudomonas sp. MPR-AND1A]|uniref:flagellin n=1 Tax=Pseudomonas sp. MPR-AND1A TaxID=2070600 RepID=UPI000CC568D9
ENRAGLGALQNRLTSTINNLGVSTENLSAANSRIRDTDIAAESSELTKASILSQAGTAVLAQANSSQNLALKLLS